MITQIVSLSEVCHHHANRVIPDQSWWKTLVASVRCIHVICDWGGDCLCLSKVMKLSLVLCSCDWEDLWDTLMVHAVIYTNLHHVRQFQAVWMKASVLILFKSKRSDVTVQRSVFTCYTFTSMNHTVLYLIIFIIYKHLTVWWLIISNTWSED